MAVFAARFFFQNAIKRNSVKIIVKHFKFDIHLDFNLYIRNLKSLERL